MLWWSSINFVRMRKFIYCGDWESVLIKIATTFKLLKRIISRFCGRNNFLEMTPMRFYGPVTHSKLNLLYGQLDTFANAEQCVSIFRTHNSNLLIWNTKASSTDRIYGWWWQRRTWTSEQIKIRRSGVHLMKTFVTFIRVVCDDAFMYVEIKNI